MSVTVSGIAELSRSFQTLAKTVHTDIGNAVAGAALVVETEMKRSIQQGPKTGRLYRRGSIKRAVTKGRIALGLRRASGNAGKVIVGANFHRASAPGEPPATDTGYLVSHISVRVDKPNLSATIGVHDVSQVVYAAPLEFGTARMAPRPFVARALQTKSAEVERRITTALDAAIAKLGGV